MTTIPTRCECADPNCPSGHHGKCVDLATMELVRIDMDGARVDMCDECASDALDSGVFATEPDDYDSEPSPEDYMISSDGFPGAPYSGA